MVEKHTLSRRAPEHRYRHRPEPLSRRAILGLSGAAITITSGMIALSLPHSGDNLPSNSRRHPLAAAVDVNVNPISSPVVFYSDRNCTTQVKKIPVGKELKAKGGILSESPIGELVLGVQMGNDANSVEWTKPEDYPKSITFAGLPFSEGIATVQDYEGFPNLGDDPNHIYKNNLGKLVLETTQGSLIVTAAVETKSSA